MVLDIAASAVQYAQLPLTRFALGGLSLAAVIALRRWSAPPRCTDRRTLHDKTFILVGCWSGPGLSLVTELAWSGAQCILLHPEPALPSVVQLLLVLRHSTANERIYAEQCDMRDVGSIRNFAKGWDQHGRGGMVGEIEQRIEAVVFADGDGSGVEQGGYRSQPSYDSGMGDHPGECSFLNEHWSALLGRHAFLQLMLPALLKSSVNFPTRIIAQVNPAYAAGAGYIARSCTTSLDLDFTSSAYPSSSPWLVEGSIGFSLLVLLREFQRRVELGPSRQNGAAGLVVLLACGGFTRQWARRTLRAEWRSSEFRWVGYALWLWLLPVIWVFGRSAEEASQELLRCCMGEVRGVAVPETEVHEVKKAVNGESGEAGAGRKIERDEGAVRRSQLRRSQLRRGAFYRDGAEVRIASLEQLPPRLPSELWELESSRVEKLVAQVIAREAKDKKSQ